MPLPGAILHLRDRETEAQSNSTLDLNPDRLTLEQCCLRQICGWAAWYHFI